jgi:hypothetical protein
MERGAIIQSETALHIVMGRSNPIFLVKRPSVSSQIATLRRLLYGWESNDKETGSWFKKAAEVRMIKMPGLWLKHLYRESFLWSSMSIVQILWRLS